MKAPVWLALSLGILAAGCVKGSTTAGRALVHPTFPYAVTYDDDKARSVLGDDWRLENYRRKEVSGDLERKQGYELKYEFDYNDDDKADATATLPFPDLVFVHRRTNARLEVSTLVLGEKLANKELRVLLQDVIDSRSGTRSLFVGFGRAALGVQKRFATRLLDSAEATLGDSKGIVATVERADLDQLQLDPKMRWQRSRLFIMHAPFQYFVPAGPSASADAKLHGYPVLLLVEYTNTAQDFEAQYPDFVRLLDKTHTLSDNMLMGYLGEALSKCGGKSSNARLVLSISGTGKASVASAEGLGRSCTLQVLEPYRFAGTGETRALGVEYDLTLPQTPAWLTQGAYREERQPAPNPAPLSEAAAPAEPAAPAAPAQPPNAEAAPPTAEPAAAERAAPAAP